MNYHYVCPVCGKGIHDTRHLYCYVVPAYLIAQAIVKLVDHITKEKS